MNVNGYIRGGILLFVGFIILISTTEDDPRIGLVRLFDPQTAGDLGVGVIGLLAVPLGLFLILKKF